MIGRDVVFWEPVIPAGNEPSGCVSIHLANAAGVSREDFQADFDIVWQISRQCINYL